MTEPVTADAARDYRWLADVETGGGPIIVADAGAYAQWRGAHSDPELDQFVVTFYGPLIADLPPRFQPSGADEWHQVIRVPDIDAARAYVVDLRAAAEQVMPGLTLREQRAMSMEELAAKAKAALAAQGAPFVQPLPDGADPDAAMQEWLSAWRDHIEQGVDLWGPDGRVLHIEVNHDTDYRRACDELSDDVAAVAFGPDGAHAGVVWETMGYGRVSVGVANDGFLLLRTWVNDDSFEELARQHAATTTDDYDEEISLTVHSGLTVVAWSPVRLAEFVGHASVEAVAGAVDQDDTVTFDQAAGERGVATAIRIPPGTYAVATGEDDEDDGWSCRWARFTRTDRQYAP